MAATSLISSSSCSNILSFNPISSTTRNQNRKVSSTRVFASGRKGKGGDHADRYHENYSSRLVDESMIVLRKRVHEMKMVERNYEPPSDWMDWEKRYYTTYDSFICQVMGFLQSHLMDTRPSFALIFLALIVLSVPTSTLMVLFRLLELAKGVGLH